MVAQAAAGPGMHTQWRWQGSSVVHSCSDNTTTDRITRQAFQAMQTNVDNRLAHNLVELSSAGAVGANGAMPDLRDMAGLASLQEVRRGTGRADARGRSLNYPWRCALRV